jgi:hypothetical protein
VDTLRDSSIPELRLAHLFQIFLGLLSFKYGYENIGYMKFIRVCCILFYSFRMMHLNVGLLQAGTAMSMIVCG